jgi:hypothetical protein
MEAGKSWLPKQNKKYAKSRFKKLDYHNPPQCQMQL